MFGGFLLKLRREFKVLLLCVFLIVFFQSFLHAKSYKEDISNRSKIKTSSISYIDSGVENKSQLSSQLVGESHVFYQEENLFGEAPEEVKLFTHGKPGLLYINEEWLDEKEIVQWFKELDINDSNLKSISIYGCNFAKGQKGRNAVSYIEKALGVFLAASTNITGIDGDWDLEIGEEMYPLGYVNYTHNLQDINGVINDYAAATNISGTIFTVDDVSAFAVGDLVMIIQMQGAIIDTSDTENYGDVLDTNGVGTFELTTVDSVFSNNIVFTSVSNVYDVNGTVQVIRVPDYSSNALTTVTSRVTGRPFDGSKGGVIALKADVLQLNRDIDASRLGFRGGRINDSDGIVAGFVGATLGAQKGEGIAKFTVGDRKKGKQANGGGAGNWINAAGGGGSNFGVGGRGGESSGSNVPESGGVGGNTSGGCGNPYVWRSRR